MATPSNQEFIDSCNELMNIGIMFDTHAELVNTMSANERRITDVIRDYIHQVNNCYFHGAMLEDYIGYDVDDIDETTCNPQIAIPLGRRAWELERIILCYLVRNHYRTDGDWIEEYGNE